MRLGDDVVDDGADVVRLLPDGDLAVRSRSVAQNLVNVSYFLAAAQLVHDVVDEGEQLVDQGHAGHLLLLAEVDQLAGDAVAGGPPFVLVEQQATVEAEAEILLDEPVELG